MRLLTAALLLPTTLLADDVNDERFWAQWRGPRMAGISPNGDPPLEWSVARNSLDDGFDASPAIVGNEMYLRGYRHLYKIAE